MQNPNKTPAMPVPARDSRVVIASFARWWPALAIITLAGCPGPSDEEIRARFNEFVNANNSCTVVSECAIAQADCPLGCYAAVRADRKAATEAEARALIKEYERGGTSCVYGGCVPPGELVCQQNRCMLTDRRPTTDAGVPNPPRPLVDAGAPPPAADAARDTTPPPSPPIGGGGGPQFSAQLIFTPGDGETNVGTRPLTVSAYDPSNQLTEAQLTDLGQRIVLRTWPDRTMVPSTIERATTDLPQGNKGFRIRPTAPLAAGWHLLQVQNPPAVFRYNSSLEGGEIATRFRPDSAPRISQLWLCAKEPPGSKFVAHVSEPVTAARPITEIITITQSSKPITCTLYDTQPTAFYFTCPDLLLDTLQVSLSAGLTTVTGTQVPPGTWTFDPTKLPPSSGCRDYRTPL